MFRPSLITLISITLVGLLLALVLLPGIAGLLEGDFEFFQWRIHEGWNNTVTKTQALMDIYAWAFWRIGFGEEPDIYIFYRYSGKITAR